MKRIHTILLLILMAAPLKLSAQLIKWDADRPLHWDDFKGRVDPARPYFASTLSGIKYGYNVAYNNGIYALTFTVECNFDKKLSWRNMDKQTPALLAHEQLHFDISELFARRLMVAFKAAKYTANYQNEVNKIFALNVKDKEEMQVKYDAETNHSVKKEKQQEWETYVKEQLAQTPSY